MKAVGDMNHLELIGLKTEDVVHMARFDCAERGIKLLVEPVAPVKPTYEKTVKVYKVAGVETLDYEFATELASLLGRHTGKVIKTDYDYNNGSDAKHVKRLTDYEMTSLTQLETTLVMSEEVYQTVSGQLYAYKTANSIYEKEKKEYDAANREYRDIEESIWEIVNAARQKQRELEKSQERFAEYMVLAEKDRGTAKKFFLKAWNPTAWVLQNLFPEDYAGCEDITVRRALSLSN